MKTATTLLMMTLLPGCMATNALRENVESTEQKSAHRLKTNDIHNGVCRIKMKYIGEDTYGGWDNKYYEFKIDSISMYLHIRFGESENGCVVISDKIHQGINRKERSDLIVDFAKNAPETVEISDLNGDRPYIFVQLSDSRSKDWIKNTDKYYEYDSIQGRAYILNNNRLYKFNVLQNLEITTTTAIGSTLKKSGYLITVPLDIVTLPIQGVILTWAFTHSMASSFK